LFTKFLEPKKTLSSISINEVVWLIFVKLTQLQKQLFPILFKVFGREICVNDEHWQKQYWPSEVIELEREICVNDEHWEKQ
jgi:hypothetical protein